MKAKNTIPPFLLISENTIVGIAKERRKPMFESFMCESVGLIATCNSCDRIIFEDENYKKEYIASGGYCKQCNDEPNK